MNLSISFENQMTIIAGAVILVIALAAFIIKAELKTRKQIKIA